MHTYYFLRNIPLRILIYKKAKKQLPTGVRFQGQGPCCGPWRCPHHDRHAEPARMTESSRLSYVESMFSMMRPPPCHAVLVWKTSLFLDSLVVAVGVFSPCVALWSWILNRSGSNLLYMTYACCTYCTLGIYRVHKSQSVGLISFGEQ